FFFQAEDGIRDATVTGVQTCALPIFGAVEHNQNPFVGAKPYQGLLVILIMLDSSDLKNSNNTLYELKEPREGATRWYVVRDVGKIGRASCRERGELARGGGEGGKEDE